MMIHDADTPILDPHRAFVKIVVDWIVKVLAGIVLNPAGVGACRVETVEIATSRAPPGFRTRAISGIAVWMSECRSGTDS